MEIETQIETTEQKLTEMAEESSEITLIRRIVRKVFNIVIGASVTVILTVASIALVFWKNTDVRITVLEKHNADEIISTTKTERETELFRTEMKSDIKIIQSDIKELLRAK